MTEHQEEILRDAIDKFKTLSVSYIQYKLRVSYDEAVKLLNEFNNKQVKY